MTEMTEKDEADLKQLLEEGAEVEFHPVLQVWREVLSNGPELAKEKVTPQWASKIVGTYTGVHFADMERMQELYFSKIGALAAILEYEINTDSDCLTYTTPELDAVENANHYKNLLRDWQLMFLQWELDWKTTDPEAAVELAAISEVHKMFFDPQGLTALLDQINFQFTDTDRDTLGELLAGLIENAEGGRE